MGSLLRTEGKRFGILGFDAYRKRGRHWQHLGVYHAKSDRDAALMAQKSQGIKVVGVRCEDCRALPIRIFRFK